MVPNRCVIVEGRTVQEAIKKGLAVLGVTRSQVSIKVLAEEKGGLFGLRGAKPAKVQMTLKGS